MFCSRCGVQIGNLPCPACGHTGSAQTFGPQSAASLIAPQGKSGAVPGAWDTAKARQAALIVYALLGAGVAISWMGGAGFVVYVIGGVVALVARGKSQDPVALSHFRWQIRTFVFGFIWGIVALVLIITIVGMIIGIPLAVAAGIWIIYRIVRGFIALQDDTSMYALT